MATNAETTTSAAPLSIGRLLIAVLIAAPLASLLASLVLSGGLVILSPGENLGDAILGALVIGAVSAIVSFPFVLGALLLIALPLTLLLVRRGVAPRTRNLIGLAVGAGIAALLWLALDQAPEAAANEGGPGPGVLLAIYAVVATIVWVAVVSWLERRKAAG